MGKTRGGGGGGRRLLGFGCQLPRPHWPLAEGPLGGGGGGWEGGEVLKEAMGGGGLGGSVGGEVQVG